MPKTKQQHVTSLATYKHMLYNETQNEDGSFCDSRISDAYRNTDHGGIYT